MTAVVVLVLLLVAMVGCYLNMARKMCADSVYRELPGGTR